MESMGNEKIYKIKGKVRMRRGEQKFEKEISAKSEREAKEKLYALFGSKNGIKRSLISIEKIEG